MMAITCCRAPGAALWEGDRSCLAGRERHTGSDTKHGDVSAPGMPQRHARIQLSISPGQHLPAPLAVPFNRHRECSNHAAPQPLPVILPLCLSLGQKLSLPLSLPTASRCPCASSALGAAAVSRAGALAATPQHLRLSRAIFSCWPQGCRSCNPEPAGSW